MRLNDLKNTGLLYAINKDILNPRGLHMVIENDEWEIVTGPKEESGRIRFNDFVDTKRRSSQNVREGHRKGASDNGN